MGLMSKVSAAARLKGFLTPRNLQYLTALLDVVTSEESPAFDAVWARFTAYFPSYPKASFEALGKLRELKLILADYLDEQ